MNFDVVIPTKNRPDDLRRIIDSINVSTSLPNKVIIVDQSEQIINEVVSDKFEVVHLHATDVSGLTAAKNKGISYCSADVIHFFDDDIILDPDYFEKLNKHLQDNPTIYGICGRQKNSKSSCFKVAMFSLFHRGCFRDIRKKCNSGFIKEPLVQTNILPGGITAYRICVFDKYQFDEALIKYCLGEDMDFSYRVSKDYKLAFATETFALHNHSAIGRYNPEESFACKIAGYTYFYEKNVTDNLVNRLSYYLVLLGVWVDAMAYFVSKRDFDSIKGFYKGFRYVREKYVNVPFLDTNKINFSK